MDEIPVVNLLHAANRGDVWNGLFSGEFTEAELNEFNVPTKNRELKRVNHGNNWTFSFPFEGNNYGENCIFAAGFYGINRGDGCTFRGEFRGINTASKCIFETEDIIAVGAGIDQVSAKSSSGPQSSTKNLDNQKTEDKDKEKAKKNDGRMKRGPPNY